MSDAQTLCRQEAWNHVAGKRWQQAAECWRQLLLLTPDDAMAHIELSKAYSRLGRYRDARSAALRVLDSLPDDPALRLELALGLRYFGEVEALVATLDGTARLMSAEQCVQAADLLASVDVHASAQVFAEAAVEKDPGFAPAYYLRGRVHMFHGRMEEAAVDFERCIALAPDAAPAHWSLSGLRKASPSHEHLDRLRAALQRAAKDSEGEAQLAYALHGELHDLGRYEEAWEALQRGCRVMRGRLRFDAAATARSFAAIESLCDVAFVNDACADITSSADPIFIVGLFRSGTTLMERILAGHSQVSAGGESQAVPSSLAWTLDRRCIVVLDEEQLRRAANADFQSFAMDYRRLSRGSAQGRAYWTEKLPSNFLSVGLIAKALPRARFLHMRRDLRDTAFSNLRTLFSNSISYTYDQEELAGYIAGYQQLMAHWRRVLPHRLLDVDYAELVRSPESAVRCVTDFCGLTFEPGMLAIERGGGAVTTASSVKVRQGIRAPGQPDWLPYAAQLEPLFRGLGMA